MVARGFTDDGEDPTTSYESVIDFGSLAFSAAVVREIKDKESKALLKRREIGLILSAVSLTVR